MVVDGDTQHRLRLRTWTCAGCGWPWPCNIILMHRTRRREARRIAAAIGGTLIVLALFVALAAYLSIYWGPA